MLQIRVRPGRAAAPMRPPKAENGRSIAVWETNRLSNEEAKDMFEKLGIPEKAHVRKGSGPSSDGADVSQLLRELRRSDVGRRPPRRA